MKNFKQKEAEPASKPKRLTKTVDDYMTKDLITFMPDTPLQDVVSSLLSNRITGAPVLDDKGKIVGLIDDKDCLKLMFDSFYHNMPVSKKTTRDYMSNVMKSVKPGTEIMEVANIFLTTPYKRLVVIDNNGALKGQISRADVLRAIQDEEWK